MGTVSVFSTPELLQRIATALSPVVASVVLTTGPNSLDAVGNLPANVYAVPYLAESLVLPTVDHMVSHGGAGGTVGPLVQGLPHLVLAGQGTSQQTIAEGDRGAGEIAGPGRSRRPPPGCSASPGSRRPPARCVGSLELLPGPDELVGLLEVG